MIILSLAYEALFGIADRHEQTDDGVLFLNCKVGYLLPLTILPENSDHLQGILHRVVQNIIQNSYGYESQNSRNLKTSKTSCIELHLTEKKKLDEMLGCSKGQQAKQISQS